MRTRATVAQRLTDLTSAQVPARVRGATLVWPIGGIEQHGPQLPLSVDLDIPEALAQETAVGSGAYLVPGQPLSARSLPQSGGGLGHPGTVYIRGTVLVDYLRDAVGSLAALEPARIVVVNGHYENEALLFEALDECRAAGALGATEIIAFSWWSLVAEDWIASRLPHFPGWHAEHAGVTETSLMMYLRPDLVTGEKVEHDTPPRAGVYLHPIDEALASNGGALSSSTGATPELGEDLFWHIVDAMGDLIGNGHGLKRPDTA
ncbi:creatininase family protein [Streptomyces sp. NPDC087305]|uniref:creatininase family protein n=1 Tax=unclassified Streptomyces TaxID=2593676 RepID=UPI0033335D5E